MTAEEIREVIRDMEAKIRRAVEENASQAEIVVRYAFLQQAMLRLAEAEA